MGTQAHAIILISEFISIANNKNVAFLNNNSNTPTDNKVPSPGTRLIHAANS